MRDILPVVVDGLWRQGAKNLAVSLVSAEGQPLPAWTPGAHIDLHLPCGLIRQYSLTGSPAERDRYLLCIARESQSRGGSRYIHDTLRPGQPLMISAPRNHFPLHEGGHVVLLAAGIGITPLLAMAHARAASGASFTLHYYVSRAQEAAFATEIARQLAGGICQIHCSDEGQSPRQRLAQDLGLRTPTPGSTSAVRPDLWPGFAIPRGRSDGERNNCTAKRSSRPPRRRRRRRTEPSPSPSPPPGSAGRCRGQNHRPGAAGTWRRGAALLRDGDLRRLPDAGTRGNRRPPGYRAVGGGKTGRRAAYCAVLLPQPVGQFSYRSRGISGPSPAGRRGRPVSPVRRRRQSPSRSTAADRCR
ncbi:Flavodoxin reductases (ferredoxin-NADPH reductases) family 1 [Klebsiella pneumoniae]|nr:Flavodoxin reductases (ferredoxin-NADPH reductases) family 1 [Klebsiella pneumoniae]